MSITFTDYGTNSFGTSPDPQSSVPTIFTVTSVRQNEIDFSTVYQGTTYQVITKGSFDQGIIGLVPKTLDDILKSGLPSNVTNFYITGPTEPVGSLTINPGISLLSIFSLLIGKNLSDFNPLSGDDVYITSNVKLDSQIFLYGGNDIIYQNHLLNQYNDVFYGGDGVDTVVFQGKSTDFTINYSTSIWDELNRKSGLEGFIIKDNNGIINTTQVNQIEKLQFSDKTIDLSPYISTSFQSISVKLYGDNEEHTFYKSNSSPINFNNVLTTKFTNTEVDLFFSDYNISIINSGLFDTSNSSMTLKTFADLLSKNILGFVNNFKQFGSNGLDLDVTYSKALTLQQLAEGASPTSNIYYQNLYSGNDDYWSSNDGTSNNVNVFLYGGDDTFHEQQKFLSNNNDVFFGGDGTDTAIFSKNSKLFTIQSSSTIVDKSQKVTGTVYTSGYIISDNTKSINTLEISQVEKIQFGDLTLDTTSLTKTASLSHSSIVDLVELYIASFNRAPDSVGLDYWGSRYYDGLNKIENGMSLEQIAKSFFTQKETIAAYPSNMATKDFVTTVYNNVLSRGPDSGGLNYWVGQLDKGSVSKDSFLLAIINGAMAPTGSAVDRQTLANKEAVGEHYAIYQGLNNSTYWAKDVMSGVTDQMSTVVAANTKSDAYAALAANPATSDLVVKLVGVAV
jgi:hypothetical protein